jgi:hypothetical protein
MAQTVVGSDSPRLLSAGTEWASAPEARRVSSPNGGPRGHTERLVIVEPGDRSVGVEEHHGRDQSSRSLPSTTSYAWSVVFVAVKSTLPSDAVDVLSHVSVAWGDC